MARKTKEEAEKTRLELINAALTVFLDKGYSKTTLQDIATVAGVTRGAVYWHFKNKKEIFKAVMDTAFDPIYDFWEKRIDKQGDPVEAISRLLEAWLDEVARDTMVVRAFELSSYKAEQGIELKDFVEQDRKEARETIALLVALFERGIQSGQFRQGVDPVAAAISFWAILVGHVHVRLQFEELLDWKAMVKTQLAIYLKGIVVND